MTSAPMPDATTASLARPSLTQRVVIASAWSLGGHGLGQVIRFGSNLLMTRLLVPEMFGVMAIATIILVGLAMFSDLGIRQSIVQSRRGCEPAFLNSAWSMQILRGLSLWIVSVALSVCLVAANWAGWIPPASVYANSSLPYVISVFAFTTVISGFGTTKVFEASRNLSLGRITRIELAAQVVGLAVMLLWATFDRSVWTLVAGAVVASTFGTIAGHVWLPGTANRWTWDADAVSELMHFGKWVFTASILGFLVMNADRVILGGLIDQTTFGVYAIACLMFGTIDQLFSRITGNVVFPAVSEVVQRDGDLRAACYRFHAIIAPAAFVCTGFLITAGQTLVTILYDHRYSDAGWMLQVLSVGLLMTPLQISGQAYLALGRPRKLANLTALRLATLCIALPVGFTFYGLPGAIAGAVLSRFSVLPLVIAYNRNCGIFDPRKELMFLPLIFLGAIAGHLVTILV